MLSLCTSVLDTYCITDDFHCLVSVLHTMCCILYLTAWYMTRPLIQLTPKGVVLSFLLFSSCIRQQGLFSSF